MDMKLSEIQNAKLREELSTFGICVLQKRSKGIQVLSSKEIFIYRNGKADLESIQDALNESKIELDIKRADEMLKDFQVKNKKTLLQKLLFWR